jgi:hypothetical protein
MQIFENQRRSDEQAQGEEEHVQGHDIGRNYGAPANGEGTQTLQVSELAAVALPEEPLEVQGQFRAADLLFNEWLAW